MKDSQKESQLSQFDSLFGDHLGRLQSALGKATDRHTMLTANLANINTPGYKRKDMDFTIAMTDASERFPHIDQWRQQAKATQGKDSSVRVDGNNVDLEREVYSVTETEMRYSALTEMLNSYFTNLKTAIKEGR